MDPMFGWTKADDGLIWSKGNLRLVRQDTFVNSCPQPRWRVFRLANGGLRDMLRNKSGSIRSFSSAGTARIAADHWEF